MAERKRTYQKTHPWLNFKIDLKGASPRLWIMLGECQSKCEHISATPLKPSTSKQLHLIYLAKGVHATTAIEGNTLSEEDVLHQLEGELKLPPSQQYLKRETQNIIDQCNLIMKEIESGWMVDLNPDLVKDINRAVLRDLPLEPHIVPGEVRGCAVVVGRYRAVPTEDCGHLLARLCAWLNGEAFASPPGLEVVHAIIKAVIAHLYLAWIHPFADGNGRTARLLEFLILIASGVPAPAAHLLSNHYNLTRSEYYRRLDQARLVGGDPLPFLEYAVQGFVDGLRAQIQVIKDQQLSIAWSDFIQTAFRERKGAANERRKALAIELATRREPVKASELPTLSPWCARVYAGKTQKTISRDVNELIELGLLVREGARIRACRERLLAFLPVVAQGADDQPRQPPSREK